MKTTPRSDDEVTRRYRDVSDELGEAPSAAARAAILAAAARQVQSRPADALSAPKPPRRSFARWPLGAAAAVLLSTLAVLMADRTEREIESELASSRADSVPEARSEAAKPATVAPPVAPGQELTAKQGNATDAEPPPPAVRREEAPKAGSRRADPPAAAPVPERQGVPASPAAPVAKSAAPAEPAPAAATPPISDAPAAKATADAADREQDRGLSSSAPAAPSAIGQLRKNERERATTAPMPSAESPAASASMAGAAALDEGKVETSAAAWLERIIELRRKGEDEQADAELKKFRERYPEVVIPPQAQRVIGTR